LVAVHGLVDGLYLQEMAAKIRRGLAGQAERGYATGAKTYGYNTVPVPDPSGRVDTNGYPTLLGKKLVINENEARHVRRIFQWYDEGVGVYPVRDSVWGSLHRADGVEWHAAAAGDAMGLPARATQDGIRTMTAQEAVGTTIARGATV